MEVANPPRAMARTVAPVFLLRSSFFDKSKCGLVRVAGLLAEAFY